MKAHRLRTNSLAAPVGIDDPTPELSWWLESTEREVLQAAYRIEVMRDGRTVWYYTTKSLLVRTDGSRYVLTFSSDIAGSTESVLATTRS